MQFLGGRVNLVGDCQGGWLAVVYAGLHPEHVNTLTIGGAPIDTHAGQSAIQEWTRLLARRNELAVYRTLVRVGGGVQRGKHQLTGFKLVGTARTPSPHDLLDLPLDLSLFVHNELARGVLVVDGKQVNLSPSIVRSSCSQAPRTTSHRQSRSGHSPTWSDSSRAHIARAGRCRTPRPVHGPRRTGRALDADCRTSADVLERGADLRGRPK